MIIKSFELKKKLNQKTNYFLLYGENEGSKNEIIQDYLLPLFKYNVYKFFEDEILADTDVFEESIYSKSFFEDDKLIIIDQATNKIAPLIEKIIDKKISNIKIIIKAGTLDKKSKLRNLFEKNQITVTIPLYEDTNQSLLIYAQNFFNLKKIKISTESLNLIVSKSKNKLNVKNEIEKILSYCYSKNSINHQDLLKIVNSSENQSISKLVDNCLSKNKNKILKNLNEYNFSIDDNIVILKTFLLKLKRLYQLHIKLKSNSNIDNIINSYKPPIFWKDKDAVKQQLNDFDFDSVIKLLKKTNEVELLIKKNNQFSNNIISDFINCNFT